MILAPIILAVSAWSWGSGWGWNAPAPQAPASIPAVAQKAWGWQSGYAVRIIPNDYWFNHTWKVDLRGYASPVSSGSGAAMVEDPYHYHQWPLSDGYLNMPRAWAIAKGEDGNVVVALSDVEFDGEHYDLKSNVYDNWRESRGTPGEDDDGNGVVDDTSGWDANAWDNDPALEYGSNQTQHGTTMGSIFGARTNNEKWAGLGAAPDDVGKRAGIAGIAWNAKILPIKTAVAVEQQSFAAEYACAMKGSGANVRVMSMSWLFQSEYLAWLLRQNDILGICGAGNSNNTEGNATECPAGMLVVGAVDETYHKDTGGEGSSYGPRVDLVCYSGSGNNGYADYNGFSGTDWDEGLWFPRSSVTKPTYWTLGFMSDWERFGIIPGGVKFEGNVANRQGGERAYGIIPQPAYTSGATAQAAGVAALLFTYRPELTAMQAKAMMLRGCVNIDALNTTQCGGGPCAGKLGAGRLDAYRAMTLWGAVGDTVLSGDVYISGDTWIKPGATVTCAAGTVLWVAPDDIYEGDIHTSGSWSNVNCYPWLAIDNRTFTNVPAATSPKKVEIYVSGTFDYSKAVIKAWLNQPRPEVWSGIYIQGDGSAPAAEAGRVRDSRDGVVGGS